MTVTAKPPPPALIRVLNPIMRVLLPSRLGRRMAPLAVLRFTGHRSGLQRDIPAGVHEFGDHAVVFTDRPWRLSLRDGAEVVVRRGGVARVATAELVEDPALVAPALASVADRVGPRRVGLSVTGDGTPAVEDYAAAGKSMIELRYR